jgi:TolA-binding protein
VSLPPDRRLLLVAGAGLPFVKLAALLWMCLMPGTAPAASFDHASWGRVFQRSGSGEGHVDDSPPLAKAARLEGTGAAHFARTPRSQPRHPEAAAPLETVPELDAAFRLMYQLQFADARARISAWQKDHPADSFGFAALAATYLFEELYRQGVFTSAFFLDDKRFLEGIEGKPDEARRRGFLDAIHRAHELAGSRLAANTGDAEALFVLTISNGMLADYTSLIEKRHLAALKFVREAEDYSKRLLVLEPGMKDGYVALGTANYIIGSLPGYKQFFLRLGGIHGDRARGMAQLEQAVRGGHYLQPFAKIMLALVSLREKQPDRARMLLSSLAHEFPANPVFLEELDRITPKISQ